MENKRNSYIISKALYRFVFASILTAAAGQLASTFDAIVVAQFVGEEAVSALSLVMPVTTFISCLGVGFLFHCRLVNPDRGYCLLDADICRNTCHHGHHHG